MWPAGRIALRSLIETPITLPPLPDIFSSSPIVDCSIRAARIPRPRRPAVWSIHRNAGHALARLPIPPFVAMIPLIAGVAPLKNVEWPTAVTVECARSSRP